VAAELDDWIDQPIEVELVRREENSTPQHADYTLEGADERGILLGYVDESDPSEYLIAFFPWHKIEHTHLLTPLLEAIEGDGPPAA
jgi:hypothetical protein